MAIQNLMRYKLMQKSTGNLLMFGTDPTCIPGVYLQGVLYDLFDEDDVEWVPITLPVISDVSNQIAYYKYQMQALELDQHRKVREWILSDDEEEKAALKDMIRTIDSQIRSVRDEMSKLL